MGHVNRDTPVCVGIAMPNIESVRREGYKICSWEVGKGVYLMWEQRGIVPSAISIVRGKDNVLKLRKVGLK